MLLIRQVELDGVMGLDVRCREGRIIEVGRDLGELPGETTIDARGGALIPGLHDHHIHLLALAASRRSVRCGPPEVTSTAQLRTALDSAPGTGWIRGVGYVESVSGMLDREMLDGFCGDRPVRIQHRSGKMWFLNSLACAQLGLEPSSDGQLFREDTLLRERLDHENIEQETLDVEATSDWLASYGVTGITDTTHSNNDATARLFGTLNLSQRVMLMGNEQLAEGPLKIMLDDYALPEIGAFRKRITRAHERDRPVAVHCVTRTELVFAVSTLLEAGTISGDRIEHASVTDDPAMELIARSGLTVVTQPNLILERGNQYLDEVDHKDHPYLYRCRGFVDAGVPLGGGTDAPFGRPDPWAAMRAAVTRQTDDGRVIGECEALTPRQALALFTTHPDDPGGPERRIAPGEAADLCLLAHRWTEAQHRLRSDDVAATIMDGVVTFERNKLT